MTGPTPFRIEIPDSAIADLKERLSKTIWPGEIKDSNWGYGTDLSYLRELTEYWAHRFDWRAQEERLNAVPQFKAKIDGVEIHFLHMKGKGPKPAPLVLSHGWPSSFSEFYKVIAPLSDPAAHGGDAEDALDVIVPSLPGYGFSQIPDQPGMTPMRIAELWGGLMSALGYEKFFVHGSDWGSFVSSLTAYRFPERVLGLHVTMISMAPPPSQSARKTNDEQTHAAKRQKWRSRETGYVAIQSTRPQTLAYGLTDSPVGLAAWIVEKWRRWSDCHGDIESRFTKDELLTNISIYWFTRTINSSMRLYYENVAQPFRMQDGEKVTVPTAFALFPAEGKPPRSRAERAFNVTRWTEMPKGGHFPAEEEPALLIEDIRAALRPLR